MGILERFEKKVEGAVSAVFARTFKGDVQPVEITARLQRELDAEAKLMSRDKRLVPNQFSVHLAQSDHDKLSPYAKTLNTEIGAELRRTPARWATSSTDRSRSTSSWTPDSPPAGSPSPPRPSP